MIVVKANRKVLLSPTDPQLSSESALATFSPKVAKNDFVNQLNCLAWGWHIVGGREFEAPTPESFKMVAALLFKKMQQHFRTGRRSIIPDLTHSVR
jgi:hypothetical protein